MHSLSCLRSLVAKCLPVRHDQHICRMASTTVNSRSDSNHDRNRTLDHSWSLAADLYLRALVPRFTPWLLDGVQEIINARDSLPPHSPILLPCCGPGHEIPLMYRCLRGKHLIRASDLSQGMVQLAKQVIVAESAGLLHSYNAQSSSRGTRSELGLQISETDSKLNSNDRTELSQDALHAVSTVLQAASDRFGSELLRPVQDQHITPADTAATSSEHGLCMVAEQLDAAHLDQQYAGKAAAVFSVFGLQQLGPLAPQVLSCWGRCLAPGGLMVVVMWPSTVEPAGLPWSAYDQALKEQLADEKRISDSLSTGTKSGTHDVTTSNQHSHPAPQADRKTLPWEQQLLSQLKQDHPDLQVLSDEYVQHEIKWGDAEECWQVMTYGGPWHARRLVSGDDFMDQLKQRWIAKLQFPEMLCALGQQLTHHPTARVIVVKRPVTAKQSPRL